MDKKSIETKSRSSLKGYMGALVLFGLVGQIAWNIENMYFNTFLFNYIGGTTTHISIMVAASAITATFTALFMGALSDKLNKRKIFICLGTILWGVSTMAFAAISRENIAFIFKNSTVYQITTIAVAVTIILDCIMTFMGSLSNDGAFNSWVTDITDDTNRSHAEGILSALPMLAMLLVVALSGMLIDAFGYAVFFILIGTLVIISGIIGIFIIKESRSGIQSDEKYWSTVFYGFKPSVMKKHKNLYIIFVALAVFNIGMQFYMPYIIIYLEKYLQFDAMQYSIILAVGILIASAVGIIIGRFIDAYGRDKFFIPALTIYIIGLVCVVFFRSFFAVSIAVVVVLTGNIIFTIILQSAIRQYTPSDKVGLFQGIRMIFFVLIPMTIGPFFGNFIISTSNQTYINEYNEMVNIPVPEIYLGSALFSLLLLIPMLLLKVHEKKQNIK